MARNYWRIEVYRRYKHCEAVEDIYCNITSGLNAIEDRTWRLGVLPLRIPDYGGMPALHLQLARKEYGVGSHVESLVVNICNRSRTEEPDDDSIYDDQLLIRFDANLDGIDFRRLTAEIFPSYVKTMSAYSAFMDPQEVLLEDMEEYSPESLMPDDKNGRSHIDRIGLANFWDRTLCKRAFGLSPETIVDRVKAKVAEARVYLDGVLLIYSYECLTTDQARQIDPEVRALISGSKY